MSARGWSPYVIKEKAHYNARHIDKIAAISVVVLVAIYAGITGLTGNTLDLSTNSIDSSYSSTLAPQRMLAKWSSEKLITFTTDAITTGFEFAFEKHDGRFPLLRELSEYHASYPDRALTYEHWLKNNIERSFARGNREMAFRFKGFLTCLSSGNCSKLSELDPDINNNATRFEPERNVGWWSEHYPAGSISWSDQKLGGYGRFRKTENGWNSELGAYVLKGFVTEKAQYDSSKIVSSPFEIRFYSPCTFTGWGNNICTIESDKIDRNIVLDGRCASSN